MAFFSQMPGAMMQPGIGGPNLGGMGAAPSPSAFTSPGLPDAQLAALLRMQGGGVGQPGTPQGGPGLPAPPQMPNAPPGLQPGAGGSAGMNPGMLAALLGRGMPGQMPGSATGQPGPGGGMNLLQLLSQMGAMGGGGQNGLQDFLRQLGIGGPAAGVNPMTLNSLPNFGFQR